MLDGFYYLAVMAGVLVGNGSLRPRQRVAVIGGGCRPCKICGAVILLHGVLVRHNHGVRV